MIDRLQKVYHKNIILFLLLFSVLISIGTQISFSDIRIEDIQKDRMTTDGEIVDIQGFDVEGNTLTTNTEEAFICLKDTDQPMKSMIISFHDRLPANLRLQVYYAMTGEEFREEKSLAYFPEQDGEPLLVNIPGEGYQKIKLNIITGVGQNFILEEIILMNKPISVIDVIFAKIHILGFVIGVILFFVLGMIMLRESTFERIDRKKVAKYTILCSFAVMSIGVVITNPFTIQSAPDEWMRYELIEHIYYYGKLPHGGDEQLRTAYGISYGFLPYLSAIVSAVFMRVVSVFTQEVAILMMAARMVSVVCGLTTILVAFKIADKLFKSIGTWMFVCTIACLPQYLFICTYMNNDSMAFMSVAIIIYYWICGSERNWDFKSIMGLSIGLSICILSYYNYYGFVLMSIVFYFGDCIHRRVNQKVMLKKAGYITLCCFVMAGWFFIRNACIYDGDFLGMHTMNEYKQLYGVPDIVNQTSLYEGGYTLVDMLVHMQWLVITVKSFIAMFGGLNILVPDFIYTYYCVFFVLAAMLYAGRCILSVFTKDSRGFLFDICLFIGAFITIVLSIYYSYMDDFQAQGRYIMACLFPIALFGAKGIEYFHITRNIKWVQYTGYILCAIQVFIVLLCYTKYLT